jgi:hypothetical protein
MSEMSRRSVLAAGGAVLTAYLAGCAWATSGGDVGIEGQSNTDWPLTRMHLRQLAAPEHLHQHRVGPHVQLLLKRRALLLVRLSLIVRTRL